MAEFASENDSSAEHERPYPLVVQYCGVCSLPLEYCINGPPEQQSECKAWAAAHGVDAVSDKLSSVRLDSGADTAAEEGGVGQGFEEGGEGSEAAAAAGEAAAAEATEAKKPKKSSSSSSKKKAAAAPAMVKIGRVSRNKRKFITIVGGLGGFPDIKMKDAAKLMGKQFACGCSVNKTASGAEEITIQGDVLMDLQPFLHSAFHIPHDRITIVE